MSGGARQVNGTRDGGYRQRTLKNPIGCSGTGLHSGAKVALTFHPSAPNSGIVFRRVDISGAGSEIAAVWNNVVDTTLNTTLGNDSGVRIGTVEHVMAALYGCGIDNAVIEVHGPEVPIMDGSAAPFVFLIECAGVIEQNAPRRVVEILKPIAVGGHQRTAVLVPGRGSTVSFEIDFASSLVARQNFFVDLSMGTFAAEISRARTFGFDHEVAELRAAGLARGGSLENAVVISGDRILNEDGLRYEDEFVRHKVLDSIGDLYLAGATVLGHFHGYRSGHALNNELLRAVFADRNAWRYTVLGQDSTTDADANTAWRDEAQAIPA